VITRLPLVFTLAVVCASPALASQIQVGYTGSSYGPYQTGQGGEFTLNDVNGPGATPNDWLDLSGYSSLTSDLGPGGISSFQSFCLEMNEYLHPFSNTYNASISDAAVSGGVGGATAGADAISLGTAYLYSAFAQGTLTGYFTAANRKDSAAALQQAIWWLEDELTLATPTTNTFLALLTSGTDPLFANLSAAKANADGAYGVRVLNLTTTSNGPAQDQLYFAGIIEAASVPDGGTTVALLGLGLVGLAAVRRYLA
jgi:hypothetical protein